MASPSTPLPREASLTSADHTDPSSQTCRTKSAVKILLDIFRTRRRSSQPNTDAHDQVRSTSPCRMRRSLADKPFQTSDLFAETLRNTEGGGEEPTVLYLAYGSNLSAETFEGGRGIKPISQINVVVPDLALDFSLPGIPYSEPCFAGTHYRVPPSKEAGPSTPLLSLQSDHTWNRPLIGVVYEVSLSDYAHIIATEGGGASYVDVVISCYPLPIPASTDIPTSQPFKAHTLLGPPGRPARKINYAQPSARYLKLITDGAAEHDLPQDYQDFLLSLKPYKATTFRQQIGAAIFLAFWGPIVLTLIRLGSMFADEKGRAPMWLTRTLTAVFAGVWMSYDTVFKPVFGEGERTTEKDEGEVGKKEDTRKSISWRRGSYGSEREKIEIVV